MTSGAPSTETEFADLLAQRVEHELQSKGYATIPYEDAAWELRTVRCVTTVMHLPENVQEEEKMGERIAEGFLSCGCLENPGHYDLVSVGFALGLDEDQPYNPVDNFVRVMIKTSP